MRDRGLPLLVELRNSLGETVQIGVPAGVDVVYVERVEGMRALRYASENSRRSPLHRSSAGKVLAAYDPQLLEARAAAGLPASTGYTIVVPEVFVAELSRVRQRGYARSVDETELGMSSLAVPVWARPGGPVVAAISMVGPDVAGRGRARGGPRRPPCPAGARRLTDALARGEYALARRGTADASALAGRAGVAMRLPSSKRSMVDPQRRQTGRWYTYVVSPRRGPSPGRPRSSSLGSTVTMRPILHALAQHRRGRCPTGTAARRRGSARPGGAGSMPQTNSTSAR